MTRPRMLLITAHFPFDRGEEFLETEIHFLAKAFDITIVPWFPENDQNKRRPVPIGVTVSSKISQMFPAWNQLLSWIGQQRNMIVPILRLAVREKNQLKFSPILWKQEFKFLSQAFWLLHLLFDEFGTPFDLVYSYWLTPAALAAALFRENGRARLAISRAHGGDLYHYRSSRKFLPGQAQTIATLDRVFAISQHGQDYLRQRYPQYQAKFELSRLGVMPAPCRNNLSTDGRLHLISCAYLNPIKRIALLIEALAQCTIPIKWTHLGGGALENQIQKKAERLPANIEWKITGLLSNQEVLHFYQTHPVDLFINVSASEGLPVSIMEAMSYGIPVAATDVGGSKELVHPGENGILWPVTISPQAIANSLIDFFNLPALQKEKMRQVAWEIWQDTVNAEMQYRLFTESLLSLIKP